MAVRVLVLVVCAWGYVVGGFGGLGGNWWLVALGFGGWFGLVCVWLWELSVCCGFRDLVGLV